MRSLRWIVYNSIPAESWSTGFIIDESLEFTGGSQLAVRCFHIVIIEVSLDETALINSLFTACITISRKPTSDGAEEAIRVHRLV